MARYYGSGMAKRLKKATGRSYNTSRSKKSSKSSSSKNREANRAAAVARIQAAATESALQQRAINKVNKALKNSKIAAGKKAAMLESAKRGAINRANQINAQVAAKRNQRYLIREEQGKPVLQGTGAFADKLVEAQGELREQRLAEIARQKSMNISSLATTRNKLNYLSQKYKQPETEEKPELQTMGTGGLNVPTRNANSTDSDNNNSSNDPNNRQRSKYLTKAHWKEVASLKYQKRRDFIDTFKKIGQDIGKGMVYSGSLEAKAKREARKELRTSGENKNIQKEYELKREMGSKESYHSFYNKKTRSKSKRTSNNRKNRKYHKPEKSKRKHIS